MANLNPAETDSNCSQNSGSPGSSPDAASNAARKKHSTEAADQMMLINMGADNCLEQFSKNPTWASKPETDRSGTGNTVLATKTKLTETQTSEVGRIISTTGNKVSEPRNKVSVTGSKVSEIRSKFSETSKSTETGSKFSKTGSKPLETGSKLSETGSILLKSGSKSPGTGSKSLEAGSKSPNTGSKAAETTSISLRSCATQISSRDSGTGSAVSETGKRSETEVHTRKPSTSKSGSDSQIDSEESKKPPGSPKNGARPDTNELVSLLSERPDVVEKFILEVADADNIQRLLAQRNRSSSGESELQSGFGDDLPRSKRTTSVTSDLFNNWLASSPIKRAKSPSGPRSSGDWRRHLGSLDEGELFMELIKDVSNELDLDVLCHKILVNVSLLTHADRGSLFLARGLPDNRYLIAKLFDVTVSTKLEEAVEKAKAEEIRIPFGVGVAGSAAMCKQVVNIHNAYEDPRFNPEIDQRTGYKTSLLLCVPICNYEGDVIGVAQIINKTDGSDAFTEHDIEVFQRYLTFCGIGIQNAQLFEMSVQEFRRNQILLNLARNIFQEQNNLECLVTKIMTEARELLKCERCAVFLLDSECGEAGHLERILERPGKAIEAHKPLMRRESNNVDIADVLSFKFDFKSIHFTKLFELRDGSQISVESNPQHKPQRKLNQIAKYVAATGQILNIGDVQSWLGTTEGNGESREEIEEDLEIKCILCMPILNGQKTVIGVAQLINKETGQPFTDCDVSIFEAFAIFCGLGIHNTQMYESACKLMAKQKVALECLSYHATASLDDTLRLINDEIPSVEKYNLYSFKFIDFDLTDEDTCRATIRMFLQCNLVQQFHIPYEVLCRWVLSVKKNYRPVKYHNWRHALNVAQTMFAMLKTGKMERFMTDLEILGLLVACLCHDLDHRGTNNAFQTKTESPLAILYTTSTMEHHHFDQCVMILNSDGNNIFQALSTEDYRTVMKIVENSILSTDLAMYFKKKSLFMELVENGEFDWQSESKKEILCGILMTACDVGAIAKPWEVQHKMAKLVADEFFDQGDLEKLQLNQQPMAMMDRERKDELPKMQVGFIDLICLPLYKVLSETFPWIQPLYEGTMENRKHWQDLAEKVEMGLTWIDHDVIEKPVEEFSADLESKDIEFTVTTLNCVHSQEKKTPERIADGDSMSLVSTSTGLGLGVGRNGGGGTRFASLRKSKAFGKTVRDRFSRSLYMQAQSPSKEHMSESVSNQDSLFSQTSSSTRSTDKLVAAIPEAEEKPHETKPPPKAKSKVCRII